MKKKPHIVSTVFNGVEGDSRVIKTAQAALNAGFDATIVGVTGSTVAERKEIEGVKVILLPNFSSTLKRHELWRNGTKDLRLLTGGYLFLAIPEMIALKPDLLHSHDMIGLKIGGGVIKAMRAGGRFVSWIHDIHEFVAGLKGELAESYIPTCLAWEREFLHLANHLFTVSDALAEEIQDRYNLSFLPTVIYNTPNAGDFSNSGVDIRSTIGLADDVPLVVFIGGATQLRGCDTILDAIALLDGVHIVLVSQGKYVDKLAKRANEIGISKRFHIHPYVPSHQVTTFIRTADIGIHGLVHYPNAEVAMPNKMFEYMHAGLPLSVSDVFSMKAFVEKHGIGLVFTAEDPTSCSETIDALFKNRNNFQSKITAELKQEYSWEKQEKKIQAIYKKLLEAKHPVLSNEDRERAAAWEKMEVSVFESIYARSLIVANVMSNDVKGEVRKTAKLCKSGDLNNRETLLQQAISQNPENLELLTQLADVAMARKDWGEAIQRWERMLSISQSAGSAPPKHALTRLEKARIAKAVALRKSGEFNSAEALLKQAINQNPKDHNLLTQLAEVATARKDWVEAVRRWERVLFAAQSLKISPPQQTLELIEKASINHAAALCNSGELEKAEVELQQVLNQNYENLGALTQLAEVAMAREDWDVAAQRWEQVLSVSKNAGIPTPKKALARLQKARLAQKGVYGNLLNYIYKFRSFGRGKGE